MPYAEGCKAVGLVCLSLFLLLPFSFLLSTFTFLHSTLQLSIFNFPLSTLSGCRGFDAHHGVDFLYPEHVAADVFYFVGVVHVDVELADEDAEPQGFPTAHVPVLQPFPEA